MRIVVLGGGAAGFFGAIACAEAFPESSVVILERGRKLLAKVLVSGGGRCNVTHACFDPAELVTRYPRGGAELRGPFTRFQPRDMIQWLAARGVDTKVEPDGRVFPITDDAATVANCLIESARRAGVQVRSEAIVDEITREADGFRIRFANAPELRADRVLLATGGNSSGHALARRLGHTIVPPVPSLFTFGIEDTRLHGLEGIAVKHAALALDAGDGTWRQAGPVLVTHWGLSGPAVITLSAWAARDLFASGYHATLRINWLPEHTETSLREKLTGFKHARGPQRVAAHTPFNQIPQRLWERLVLAADILDAQRWAKLPRANFEKLARELTAAEYRVTSKGRFKDEFVTCGGVALPEVNFRTMESKHCPGLFFAGEVLDIDGVTGGFNFQSAWTTGWIAGHALGR